jgi:aconitase A
MLALTLSNPSDYDCIDPTDVLALPRLESELTPGSKMTCEITKADGQKWTISLNQTFNDNQITWYRLSYH